MKEASRIGSKVELEAKAERMTGRKLSFSVSVESSLASRLGGAIL